MISTDFVFLLIFNAIINKKNQIKIFKSLKSRSFTPQTIHKDYKDRISLLF